jgi:hypothetical protein
LWIVMYFKTVDLTTILSYGILWSLDHDEWAVIVIQIKIKIKSVIVKKNDNLMMGMPTS